MYIEQLYTKCLSEAAYYIESEGEVAIIDPLRETQPYTEMAEKRGAKIKYIFETHFHADFVSGHVDLAQKTGATIIYGPNASTDYPVHIAKDEEVFRLGKISFTVLHTPGHTLESSTYLLKDEEGKDKAIFTGDTLFIGDVGRPDLAIKSDLTKEDLAAMLYQSLRNKIMPLADEVIVYPAHGAGSACGKSMSKETFDTLGNQKQHNYALRADMTEAEFVKELTTGILPAPQYFAKNAMLNKSGYDAFDEVMERGTKALSLDDFEKAQASGALVLDVRHQKEFVQGFIPNSLFIGLDGQFAVWVGTIITDLKTPILLITPEGREEETVKRLSRVGYDNCIGYLEGGFATWQQANKPTDSIKSISAEAFEAESKQKELNIVDVRKPGEFESEHLIGATSFPLDFINDHLTDLDKSEELHIHCAGGYRSVIATSILKANGYQNLVDIAGGYGAIKKTGMERTAFVCPSELA